MRIIEENRLPIYAWADEIEDGALKQAENVANHPLAFHHVALCPDMHQGIAMPIGGVAAMQGCVITNMVGVDIGCGVSATKTSLRVEEMTQDVRKAILGEMRKTIPVGFDHRNEPCESRLPEIDRATYEQSAVIKEEWASAAQQIGTLGGGK